MKSWSKMFLLALSLCLLASPALADWHTATVGVGESGTYPKMAVDPVRNRTFTANTLSGTAGTVTVVDGRTDQTLTWVAGSQPRCLAVNPVTGKLYVSINGSATDDTVVVFDTTGTIVKKLPVKKEPWSMVIDSDNDRLYVANSGSDTISIFASDTLWLSYPVNDGPSHLVLNPVNHALYITYGNSNSIGTLNLGQYSIMHIPTGQRAISLAINAAANKAYVANINEDSVTVIDCATVPPSAIKKIKVGDSPASVVTDPGAKTVYVANNLGGTVTAIDCSTNAVVSDVPVKSGPNLMAVNPVTGKLYITHGTTDNVITVLDWKSGLRDSVVLGHAPSALVLNPVTNKIYVRVEAGNPDSLAVIDGSDFDTTITVAKSGTQFAAVNTVTGDAFFSNSSSDNVTVIKATGDTVTIAVGDDPRMIAVNPLTNKAFVCNTGGKSVSVISGSSYTVERTITVDTLPTIVAVNPLTNFIYVNSFFASANRVKVIDGKDWDTTSVPVGSKPFSIAVNQATNRIYVGNDVSNNVTIIDGAHHTVITTTAYINRPYKMDVNPVTNKIYCASLNTAGKLSIIDGATNLFNQINVGNWPSGVAVNRANNKIYVTNYNDSTVTEIDGITNATATIKVGVHPEWIAADPVTGKVFVSNSDGSSLSIIDCASRSVKTMAMPAGPRQVAVNPVTGKVYLACYTAGRAVVINQAVEQDTRVVCTDPATLPMLLGATQDRDGYSYNHWSPYKTKIKNAMFSLATSQSFWKFAYNVSSTDSSLHWSTQNYLWGADSAFYGDNIYRCYPLETQGATTNNLGTGTPFVGNVLNRMLYRIDNAGPTIAWWDSLADDNDSTGGYGPYTVRAVITDFSGVDYATLYYQMIGKSWPSVVMTRASADTFNAEIPVQTLTAGDTAAMLYLIDTGDHASTAYDNSNDISSDTRSFILRNLTGVAGTPSDPTLPRTFALQVAYPNPSRGQTIIKYQLPKSSNVQLQVYNVTGQLVKTINEGQKPAGYHQINWSDGKLSNGIYFYQLKAGEFSATRKMVLVR